MRVASFSKLVSEVQRQESSTSVSQLPEKGSSKTEADDAVIVVLDFSVEALAAFEDQGLKGLFDRSALVAHVGGSLLEAGFGRAGAEDLAEFVEADLFADVELDEDQDGAAQRGLRLRRLLQLGGDVACETSRSGDRGCEFAIHKLIAAG